jgi:alpha-L-fucosidase
MDQGSTFAALWKRARFGMFIHWGVYAVPAGVYQGPSIAGASEWLMFGAKVPVEEYRAFARDFNPTGYDPEAWARAAVDAGMGYVVITAKHHDGFAMFPSAASGWNVADATPYGRDLLGPLVEACGRAGLPVGFYYSHAQDWVNGGSVFGERWDPSQGDDFDGYLDRVAIPQVRELLTRYGPAAPAVLWWDTPADMTPQRAARIDAAVQALRPGIPQNDRLGPGFAGDFDTPEQRIPRRRPGRPWETCMTMNDSWGFNRDDAAWKPASLIIAQLCEVASQGGNYLLNVGPKADGTFPPEAQAILREVGRWMRAHGEAIRDTDAGPFAHRLPWGFVTRGPGRLYLLVERWPDDGRLEVPLLDAPARATLIGGRGQDLEVQTTPGGLVIGLPDAPADPAVSVLVLEYAAEPRVGQPPPLPAPPVVVQPADGSVALLAADAELLGEHLAFMPGAPPMLGCWAGLDSYPLWRVRMHRGGRFRVEIDYAVPSHRKGTTALVRVGEGSLPFVTAGTGGWGEFRRQPVGELDVAAGDEVRVSITPQAMPAGAVMNLKAVHLVPVA